MKRQQEYLEQARQLWIKNDQKQAYTLYERLLEASPDDPVVLREYGRAVYATFDDLEQATQLFERALAVEPYSAITLLYLGDLYSSGYGQGYREALPMYQRVIEGASDNRDACVEAYLGIGMLAHVPGSPVSYEAVVAAFLKAIEIEPSSIEAHQNLGTALYERGNLQEAWKEFKVAEKLLNTKKKPTDVVQTMIRRIENNEPYTFGGYTSSSVVTQWPAGKIE